ncbi:hypothetical protein QMX34_004636 [Aeromonas hydrophila]|nr:hypothetical protein [Aeromonas hydrophila]
MKKNTLTVVLAALFTGVSGSAMAFSLSGTGGMVEFSGTLTQQDLITPWEVLMGAPIVLNGNIGKGAKNAKLIVAKPALMFGIRSAADQMHQLEGFQGRGGGIVPQIDFGGKLNLDSFANSVATLTLDVMNEANTNKIGTMTASVFSAGEASATPMRGSTTRNAAIATKQGDSFWGGVPASADRADVNPRSRMLAINSYLPTTTLTSGDLRGPQVFKFNDTNLYYSGYYGAGLEAGSEVVIALDSAPNESLKWRSSLPVTISYM